jgi:hypothetical protein
VPGERTREVTLDPGASASLLYLARDGTNGKDGGHGPVLFELVDATLDCVALPVQHRVEGGWPPALGPFRAAVGVLIGLARDARRDPAPAQIRPVGPAGVRLVGQDPVRTSPRLATADPRHPDPAQHRDKLRAVAALPTGHHRRQYLATLLARQMRLGGSTRRANGPDRDRSARRHPAGRFLLLIVESTLTIQLISQQHRRVPAARPGPPPRCHHAASGETIGTASARVHTPRARPATAPRSAPASGSRR